MDSTLPGKSTLDGTVKKFGLLRSSQSNKEWALRWRSTKWVMAATSLADKYVGLEEIEDGIWRIYFRQKMLGFFSEKELRVSDELDPIKRNYV